MDGNVKVPCNNADEEHLTAEEEPKKKKMKKNTSVLAKIRLDSKNMQFHQRLVGLNMTPAPGTWWSTVLFVSHHIGSSYHRTAHRCCF
jgi:hypothetical protein